MVYERFRWSQGLYELFAMEGDRIAHWFISLHNSAVFSELVAASSAAEPVELGPEMQR